MLRSLVGSEMCIRDSCRLCRHCHNLAEGGCLLSRFHFTRCRYFLGHVACRNLPGQGLIIHLFSTQAICFPSCSLRCCQVSLLQQRYYIGCSYPKVALLHHFPRPHLTHVQTILHGHPTTVKYLNSEKQKLPRIFYYLGQLKMSG